MPIFKPPYPIDERNPSLKSVFLAGSIEMDKAEDWQNTCEIALTNSFNLFNPRRESWDSSWEQDINNKHFREQVEWELNALEEADIIIMYFAPNTKSPISLLELGLHAKSNKMHVVCDQEFWRKGNVDVVCKKYNIPQYASLDDLLNILNNQKNKLS